MVTYVSVKREIKKMSDLNFYIQRQKRWEKADNLTKFWEWFAGDILPAPPHRTLDVPYGLQYEELKNEENEIIIKFSFEKEPD
jgi:hypothetical protein